MVVQPDFFINISGSSTLLTYIMAPSPFLTKLKTTYLYLALSNLTAPSLVFCNIPIPTASTSSALHRRVASS
uniref:Uncharacterized protein n=1 Tax=Spermophilus dauricus TaxID=99837 RepID=A0A8C9QBR2_SPEDA